MRAWEAGIEGLPTSVIEPRDATAVLRSRKLEGPADRGMTGPPSELRILFVAFMHAAAALRSNPGVASRRGRGSGPRECRIMKSSIRVLTVVWLLSSLTAPLAAQTASTPAPFRRQVTLDATVLGGSLAYARRVSDRRLVGGGIGLGGDVVGYMLLAGRHFSQSSGLSYEEKDGFGDKLLFEMLHITAFIRHEMGGRWDFDTGARASWFLHHDSSDDDPSGGVFLGGFAGAYREIGPLRFGPRLLVGAFTEGRPEFGIFIAPITIRLNVGW